MTVTNHIHLDLTTVGHDADGAPLHRWGIVGREPAISIQATVHRAATGATHVARIRDSNLDVVQHKDWAYQMRVTQTQLDYLISMLGEPCELVDNVHVADNISHTPYVQDVAFTEISQIEPLGSLMYKYNVTIQLVDLEDPA